MYSFFMHMAWSTWCCTTFMKQHGMNLTAWQQTKMQCMTCDPWCEAPSAKDIMWTFFILPQLSWQWPVWHWSLLAYWRQWIPNGREVHHGSWHFWHLASWCIFHSHAQLARQLVHFTARWGPGGPSCKVDHWWCQSHNCNQTKTSQTNKLHHITVAIWSEYSPWQPEVAHQPPTQVTQQITKSKPTP